MIYIGLTLMLGFAAVNTGNNLLYLMVSALLGFMAISGLLGQQNLQRLHLKVLPLDDLFAGLPGRVTLELENRRRWLPTFLIRVDAGDGTSLFPLVAPGSRARNPLSLTFSRRGRQSLPDIWISSCFPINFFVRSRKLQLQTELLVFPQPLPCTNPPNGEGHNRFQQQELQQAGNDGELRSVDTYQAGDPLKAIHWKLSARTDEYKVKRLNRLGAPALMLDIDDFSGPLEQRLGQCTFLVDRLSARQQAVGLQLGELRIPPGGGRRQRLKLLTELALYDRH